MHREPEREGSEIDFMVMKADEVRACLWLAKIAEQADVKGRVAGHSWDEIYSMQGSVCWPFLTAVKMNPRLNWEQVPGMEPLLKKLANQWEWLKLCYGVLF